MLFKLNPIEILNRLFIVKAHVVFQKSTAYAVLLNSQIDKLSIPETTHRKTTTLNAVVPVHIAIVTAQIPKPDI
jgi:hypothetical protein